MSYFVKVKRLGKCTQISTSGLNVSISRDSRVPVRQTNLLFSTLWNSPDDLDDLLTDLNWWSYSSHRSISFCESMPPLSNSAIHWPIARQDSFSLSRTIFSSPFGSRQPQIAPSSQPWQTSLAFTEEHAATGFTRVTRYSDTHTHTLPTNSRTNILTSDTKRDTFSLLLFYTCYLSLLCFQKKFRYSFVLSNVLSSENKFKH